MMTLNSDMNDDKWIEQRSLFVLSYFFLFFPKPMQKNTSCGSILNHQYFAVNLEAFLSWHVLSSTPPKWHSAVFLFAGVFADGPGAYLFHGVVEQQYVFHVMDYALCLSESKQKSCEKHVNREGKPKSKSGALPLSVPSLYSLLLIALLFL